jgi:hypothetical protein
MYRLIECPICSGACYLAGVECPGCEGLGICQTEKEEEEENIDRPLWTGATLDDITEVGGRQAG